MTDLLHRAEASGDARGQHPAGVCSDVGAGNAWLVTRDLLSTPHVLPLSVHVHPGQFTAGYHGGGSAQSQRVVRGGAVYMANSNDSDTGAQRTLHMPRVTRHTSHVTRHTPHVTRHTSHVTRHTSHVTRHTSLVTRLMLQACGLFLNAFGAFTYSISSVYASNRGGQPAATPAKIASAPRSPQLRHKHFAAPALEHKGT